MSESTSKALQWFLNVTDEDLLKLKTNSLSAKLQFLQNDAITTGFSPAEMSAILEKLPTFIAKPKACSTIFNFLIPNETIPVRSMITILFWFNSLSIHEHSEIMIAILKWIIVVFPYMEEQYKFIGYYDLLLSYIYSNTLQPYICHLLAFMTRSDDITAIRLNQLLKRSLITQTTSREFVGLLSIYKSLGLQSDSLGSFDIPNDSYWFNCPAPMLWFYIQSIHIKRAKKKKNNSRSLVLFAHRPLYLLTSLERKLIPEDMYTYFDKPTIEYENSIAIQFVTMLYSEQSNFQYILYWIDHTINSNFLKSSLNSLPVRKSKEWFGWGCVPTLPFLPIATPSVLVRALIEISEFLNCGIVTISKYLSYTLPFPSYHKSDRDVLQLLPYMDSQDFNNFKNFILHSLLKCIHSDDKNNDELIFEYFRSFSKLLTNFLRRMQSQTLQFLQMSNLLTNSFDVNQNSQILIDLIQSIFEVFYVLVSLDKLNVEICSGMLLFLGIVSSLPIIHNMPILLFPNKKLLYALFMQSSPVVLEGLLNCLSHYFLSFKEVESNFPSIYNGSDVQNSVVEFNGILRKICNLLKYTRGTNSEITSEVDDEMFKIPQIVKCTFNLKHCDQSLLLCNHWAFIGCVLMYFKKSQPEVPSTVLYHPISLLNDDKRFKEFSNFLVEFCGMKGVIRFIKLATETKK